MFFSPIYLNKMTYLFLKKKKKSIMKIKYELIYKYWKLLFKHSYQTLIRIHNSNL